MSGAKRMPGGASAANAKRRVLEGDKSGEWALRRVQRGLFLRIAAVAR